MDQPIKPIRRSKELTPLSKEHHEGLLFGWKIKQGLRYDIDPNTISQFIQWFWENDLEEHFRKEKKILAAHLPGDNELVQQMFREHKSIKALINLSRETVDKKIFLQVAEMINDHIRFEERVLFPFAEQTISPEVMQEIYQQLLETKDKVKWENEFWLQKK